MNAPFSPTAMIVLASEQLWPNIHGLVHWHGEQLGDLCIYHTAEERVSARPARSLAALCGSLYPRVEAHLECGEATPEAVHRRVTEWMRKLPGRRWLLNATGGTKLMYGGMLALVDRDDAQVVYRELNGCWYRLRRDEITGVVGTRRIEVPADGTDRIPVDRLVRALWETEGPRNFSLSKFLLTLL